MGGDGRRRDKRIVAYGFWLALLGAVVLVAPELIWLPLLVAAIFLGTRESRQTTLVAEA